MEPHYDVVCLLLETALSKWKEDDKLWTIKNGRPTPLFGSKISAESTDIGIDSQLSWYKSFPWLCGSSYLEKLFCWPCLISGIDICELDCVDFVTEQYLNKHETSAYHLRSALKLIDMSKGLKVTGLSNHCSLSNVEWNENAVLNRRLMQLLIKGILFFTKHQIPIDGCHKNKIVSNNDSFNELLHLFISESPLELQKQYKKVASYFESESLQNDLIDCLSSHVNEFVKKDVSESSFYSIQLDRVSQCHCLIIVRYVTCNSIVVERPLGFLCIRKSSSAEEFFEELDKVLSSLDYQNKLVAQSYDGASIKENLSKLQNQVKLNAKQAMFVHSCNHEFGEIIVQSVNNIPECKAFFTTLCSIPRFFDSSTKALSMLNSALAEKEGKLITKENKLPKGYEIVHNIYEDFFDFNNTFKTILSDPSFNDAVVRQANSYLKCFNDMEFIFLLSVFNVVFKITHSLIRVLKAQISNILNWVNKIQYALIKHRRFPRFDVLYKYSKERAEMLHIDQSYNQEDVYKKFKQLYFKIVDSIGNEISIRFNDFKNLEFIKLAHCPNRKSNKNFKCLNDFYPNVITDLDKLKKELKLFFSRTSYKRCSPQETVKKMKEDGSCEILKEVYKLFLLIVTLPYINVSLDSHISCPRRIQSCLKNCNHNGAFQNCCQSSLAMLSVGQEVIDHLTNTSMFYDDIIDRFARLKGEEIPLIVKR